ncbi:hypothetical protein A3860_18590 [Niastella vici]|uniref:Uncharacterized protein n=1 Tax=Niastella vici TaxID=1703345 RepID=A0A1V9G2G2_9BACT|nr:hypothetical protein A3860_18590 [Niastella vici]
MLCLYPFRQDILENINAPTMFKSKQILDSNDNRREDFKLKVWFMEISWGRLSILSLVALVIILIFVLVMVKL